MCGRVATDDRAWSMRARSPWPVTGRTSGCASTDSHGIADSGVSPASGGATTHSFSHSSGITASDGTSARLYSKDMSMSPESSHS